jgi:hypothetical protein
MNSDVPGSTGASEVCVRALRAIRILTAIYVALLTTVSIMMWPWSSGFLMLPTAIFPAVVYASAAFVYGRALFGNAGSTKRAHAWLRLLKLTGVLNAAFAIVLVCLILTQESDDASYRIWAFRSAIAIAIAIALLALWAYIAGTVFVRDGPSFFHTKPTLVPKLPGLVFLTGGVLMLCSLALNVGYESTGWSVLRLQGEWVFVFTEIDALGTRLDPLTLVAYAVGLVLAVLAVTTGVVALVRKPSAPKNVSIVSDASVVVLWFTLTNYCFACIRYEFVNFLFPEKGRDLIITVAWLLMFIAGTALWFRYRNRGRTIRTMLMVWYLPLMPAAIATFWFAAHDDFKLYGLILYVVGLQIVTACWWKLRSVQETFTPNQALGFGRMRDTKTTSTSIGISPS